MSYRLANKDYGSAGKYFVTLCCKNMVHSFGQIQRKTIRYNKTALIAQIRWLEIPLHFENVVLHEFVVMPNHLHGIIEITETVSPHMKCDENENASRDGSNNENDKNVASRHVVMLREIQIEKQDLSDDDFFINYRITENEPVNREFGPLKKGSVSVIVGQFKAAVSRWCNKNDVDFQWQRRFHDRVIRNEREYNRIANYIRRNPEKWKDDEFYK